MLTSLGGGGVVVVVDDFDAGMGNGDGDRRGEVRSSREETL